MAHRALGRGLEALLKPASGGEKDSPLARISVDRIRPNRHQPRVRFSTETLTELADSIKRHGLAQPILVSPTAVPGEYELVAGERRLRAARMAGLADVPCIVRPVTEPERHELALVENIQRENLNAIEEAESLRKLMDHAGLTQDELARRLGKSRSAVANKLRLLDLPQMLRNALMENLITEGHARALLGLPDRALQEDLGKRVVQEKLTVRDVEKRVADWDSAHREGRVKPGRRRSADVRHLEEDLQRALGRRVTVQVGGKARGWLKLEFYSPADLDVLIRHLKSRTPHR